MFIEIIKAIFYGILEGITEWLPVSSTGHLILLNELLALNVAPELGATFAEEYWSMFEVMIQLGAILAVVVMFFGAMAGSTAGGIKLSRIVIAVKGTYINVRKLINPRYVPKAKFEGKSLEEKTINDVFAYITLYSFILLGTVFLLSFDPINGETVRIMSDAGAYEVKHGFFTNFSASLACISNVGPAFEAVGPYASYVGYSWFSKIVLSRTMLLGRLEILPVLILFSPKTWKRI